MTRALLLSAVGVLLACAKPLPGWVPDSFCPDARGCASGSAGKLFVGAAKRDVSPSSYEVALPRYLSRFGRPDCPPFCGSLTDLAYKDCGTDMLCPGDSGYPGPDKDGTEGDGVLDFFRDCGRDGLCPGDPGYPGPDPDGSEHNGKFDGFWLAGFGSGRPVQSSHDSVWARAVVLKNGDTSVALVAIDAVGIFYENEVVTIRSKVRDLGGKSNYVAVAATHDHEAPDTLGQWGQGNFTYGQKRGVDPVWLDQVTTLAAEAVVEAEHTATEARAYFASTSTGYDGWAYDSRDPLIFDDTLTAARFEDVKTGATIATLVNWASHPESLASDNNSVTADYVGYVRDAVEQGLPATPSKPAVPGLGGVALYFNGTLGGLITPLHTTFTDRSGVLFSDASFEKAQAAGENVAEAALAALSTARPVEGNQLPLSFAAQTVKLQVENVAFQIAFSTFNLFDRPTYAQAGTTDPFIKSEVGTIRLGPARFVCIPGEMFPEVVIGYDPRWSFGHPQIRADNPNPPNLSLAPPPPYLKDQFPAAYQFMLGLANDEVGYLVPPYDYQLSEVPYVVQPSGDHYEETNSLGPKALPALLDLYSKLDTFAQWQSH